MNSCGYASVNSGKHCLSDDGIYCIVCKINEGVEYERSSTEDVQSEDVL